MRPVLNYAEITSHEEVQANGYIAEMARPATGRVRVTTCPIFFSAVAAHRPRLEPRRGKHTDEVSAEGGYGEQEIATREGGVIQWAHRTR